MASKPDKPFTGFEPPVSNYSKLPHQLIGELPRFSSLAELKVVLYTLRHTWGYHDDYKRISLEEFQHGRKERDGTRIDDGVGMSKPSIIDGIRRAIEHGFLFVMSDDTDKARIRKFYSLTEAGLKGLTSEVKNLYPDGQEVLPRTEKDTKERNIERYSAKPVTENPLTDDNSTVNGKHQQANPWYDAIQEIWGFTAGRNMDYQKFLTGQSTKKQYRDYQLPTDSGLSPELLKQWAAAYRKQNPTINMVTAPDKVQSELLSFLSALSSKNAPTPSLRKVPLAIETLATGDDNHD